MFKPKLKAVATYPLLRWCGKHLRSSAEHFQKIADFSGIGRSYEELFPNLRVFLVGNYIIFYHPTEKGISIERILRRHRDLDTLFSNKQTN